jgi:hypothetical protein
MIVHTFPVRKCAYFPYVNVIVHTSVYVNVLPGSSAASAEEKKGGKSSGVAASAADALLVGGRRIFFIFYDFHLNGAAHMSCS